MLAHQRQPSRTSCGPACVAMLAGVPVAAVLDDLPRVRVGARTRKRTHTTNVAELIRLLKPFGMTLGRRVSREPAPLDGSCVLRIPHTRGRNWHWAVLHQGVVYDPSRPGDAGSYEGRAGLAVLGPLSWYRVETLESFTCEKAA